MLLKTKFVNQLTRLIDKNDLRITVKNILINGSRRGCSGHITYLPTGRCVYIDTESALTMPGKLLYRYAMDEKDFSSNRPGHSFPNLYTSEDNLAESVARLLLRPADTQKKVSDHV